MTEILIAVFLAGFSIFALIDGAYVVAGVLGILAWCSLYLGLRGEVEDRIRTSHFSRRGLTEDDDAPKSRPEPKREALHAPNDGAPPGQPLRIDVVDGDAMLADVRKNALDFENSQRGWKNFWAHTWPVLGFFGLCALFWHSVPYGLIALALVVVAAIAVTIHERRQRRENPPMQINRPKTPPDRRTRLLMLRVFGESVIGPAIATAWGQAGYGWPVLLAGPDIMAPPPALGSLVRAYSQASEPFESLKQTYAGSGALVRTIADADAALSIYRNTPAHETRLLCDHDVWQYLVEETAKAVQYIVFDLSGVDESAAGALYELDMVLQRVPLDQVLFVVDYETPIAGIEAAARAIWSRVEQSSPNSKSSGSTMLLARFRVDNLLRRAAAERLDPDLIEEIMWPIGDLIRRGDLDPSRQGQG